MRNRCADHQVPGGGEATPTNHTHALTHTSKQEREEPQEKNRTSVMAAV